MFDGVGSRVETMTWMKEIIRGRSVLFKVDGNSWLWQTATVILLQSKGRNCSIGSEETEGEKGSTGILSHEFLFLDLFKGFF